MPIQFACQCGKTLKAADEHAGKRAKCKHCGQAVIIPGGNKMAATKAASPAKLPAAAVQKKTAPGAAVRAASAPAAKPAPKPAAISDLSDLFDDNFSASSASPIAGTAQTAGGSKTCPGCYQSVSSAAVICTDCGHNFRTGERTATTSQSPSARDIPRKKPRRPSGIGRFFHSRLTSGKLWSGVGMMVGAVVWFVVGLAADRIFFYPPILFILGLISFFKGLIDGDNA